MAFAIGYRRCSTLGQVDGEGLGVQTERIEGWCRLHGVELRAVEEDLGISGASADRPGLRRAIEAVLALGEEGVLVVARLDRLGRSAVDVQIALQTLMAAKVRVVSVSDGIDTGAGVGRAIVKLLVGVLSTFGELEREMIRDRLLAGRHRASRENRIYGSEPAYGRRVADDDRTLVVDDREAHLVGRARELRASGSSFRAICLQLAADGFHPRRASAWSPTVVRRLVLGRRGVVGTPP